MTDIIEEEKEGDMSEQPKGEKEEEKGNGLNEPKMRQKARALAANAAGADHIGKGKEDNSGTNSKEEMEGEGQSKQEGGEGVSKVKAANAAKRGPGEEENDSGPKPTNNQGKEFTSGRNAGIGGVEQYGEEGLKKVIKLVEKEDEDDEGDASDDREEAGLLLPRRSKRLQGLKGCCAEPKGTILLTMLNLLSIMEPPHCQSKIQEVSKWLPQLH